MNKSESIKELAAALSKAQSEIKGAIKDAENPFFKNVYADLASVWDAIRVPMAANNLAVSQTTSVTENGTVLVTTLLHSSGEWIEGTYPLYAKDNSPQSLGSAVTYARRYALQAIMGVAPIEDDGEAAEGRGLKNDWNPQREMATPPKTTISEPQAKRLFAIAKSKNISNDDLKDILNVYGYASSKDIKWTDYDSIIKDIELAAVK